VKVGILKIYVKLIYDKKKYLVYYKMVELSVEHILLFVILAFLLYHLLGNCGCRDGFSVGGNFKYNCAIIDQKYKNDENKKCKCLDAGCYYDNKGMCSYIESSVNSPFKTTQDYYNNTYKRIDKNTPGLGLCGNYNN
jgi:hypothetical protein